MGAIQLGQYGYNKLISVCYDGSNTTIKFYANGAFSAQDTSTVASLPSSSSESLQFRNLVHWGDILIYRDALSDADRELVEGYLAHKFGMLDTLPTSHSSRTSLEGWAMGKGEGPNEVSSTLSNVGNRVNGSSSTVFPSTDNQWHHVVSTFDGGTRKIYLDGTEVSSIEFSGQVTATNRTLVFGAIDFNSSAAAEEEVKNIAAAKHSGIKLDEVRFYDSALSSAEITHMYNYGKGDLAKVGGFSTVPTTISGTAGTALSTTVAADFPNASL